jgi:hypothetical protein
MSYLSQGFRLFYLIVAWSRRDGGSGWTSDLQCLWLQIYSVINASLTYIYRHYIIIHFVLYYLYPFFLKPRSVRQRAPQHFIII